MAKRNLIENSLNSISAMATQTEGIANISGNEKLVSQAAKVQKTASQVSQALSGGKEVIQRIQQVSDYATTLKTPSMVGQNTQVASLSPTELLTALFKRSPSGLQFTLEAGGLLPTTFSVIEFTCAVSYSELYTLDISVSSSNPAIEPGAVLDNYARLSVWQDGTLLQTFVGMVTDFEQGDSGFRLTHYRLRIRPDLWRATLRQNSRIFQQKNIQTILSTLLDENKVADYAFVLRHEHPEREFCVQYQESDFAFFQRLTAEEGIFYYFEQQDGQHRLIMTDDATTLSGETVLPYNLNRGAQLQEKSITSFNRSERVRQSEVTLKDYTFKKPNWQATFNKPAEDTQHQRAMYEHYDYPGRFKDGRGEQYTRYRLDSLRQDAHLGWGESNSPNLQVGKLFRLQHHPNDGLNTDWQVVSVVYEGKQPQSSELESGDKGTTLTNRFEFMPRDQTWRPLQRTKPRVDGPQIAIVTGPAGEEIYTDNFGRVRLQFLWDREGRFDDHSSCWIRVTQPWAGKGWGMMAIPRVGQEIVVDFLDGDPDQPIVTGRTYHANMPLPAELPAGKTQMHVMSQTYKDGGYNGMIMEDATGNQRLDFQAQKDMNTKVLNDQSASIGNNRSLDVTGNDSTTIGQNRTIGVTGSESTTVGKGRSVTVSTGDDRKTVSAGNMSEKINGNRTLNVKGDQSLTVSQGNRNVTVSTGDDTTEISAGNLTEKVPSGTHATSAKTITSNGSESITLTVGGGTITMTTSGIQLKFGSSTVQLNAGGVFVNGTEIHLNK
ncbi:type VI secretion system tip protein TssI/VgrG [Glaesserella sp.]|uniref:type VI secretion system Vgr family protein n=1 Tax=Glaesserella sp. TaxID=2094731 RepID=UPI00359F4951